ncbi:phage tail tube protein [Streptomyces europaeiscabiei]|uniref:phage tail tube protein n=1 Tax=Streptomyces europaeiscabiei TaxID=146819 RepID=UPI0029A8AA3A|nr:phage tail protein [Streptomyces europaeiscabiei]MDX3711352.1 phage tail protein [Streptomyces europaeiscabiei]MDX3863323.1 phage tail protein [Streptomyces europaeiscabiei]MDX3872786.1 phage tail protein [Streptomyces europaeiscabiei]
MAGSNANEIRVAGTGRILVAPVGTTAPTDVTSAWGSGWKDLGFTSQDGIKLAKKDKLDPVETWQSVSPARFIYSDRDLTVKFQLLQLNEDTLPFFMGGDTVAETTTGSGVYKYELAADPKFNEKAMGIEFSDGTDITYRFVVSRGQVTESEELSLTRTASIKLGVTFTALAVDNTKPLATFLMKDPAYGTAS